ncbi:MAG TPA: universal stress protein [Candidatus Acidoferrales bacterium]|jgi:nucleotide-binding universal stress UspA family protein|nr:universal stress protein [Candidatus Acidoferrales bacterium]
MLSERILLAYDGSEQARRALDFAVELTKLSGAKLGVVSVVPVHAGRLALDPWDDASVHTSELREARDRIHAAGITPTLHEPFGDIAEAIVRTALDGGYDHIVMGSRHSGLFDRILHGSVSEAVVTEATTKVTIVH